MNKNDTQGSSEEKIQRQSYSRLVLLMLLSILAFIAIGTNPVSGGPIAILSFLFLLLALIFMLFFILAHWSARVFFKTKISSYKLLYMTFSLAIGAVFLIGLQTLQQLRLVDVLLVLLFEFLLNFYFLRRF